MIPPLSARQSLLRIWRCYWHEGRQCPWEQFLERHWKHPPQQRSSASIITSASDECWYWLWVLKSDPSYKDEPSKQKLHLWANTRCIYGEEHWERTTSTQMNYLNRRCCSWSRGVHELPPSFNQWWPCLLPKDHSERAQLYTNSMSF